MIDDVLDLDRCIYINSYISPTINYSCRGTVKKVSELSAEQKKKLAEARKIRAER